MSFVSYLYAFLLALPVSVSVLGSSSPVEVGPALYAALPSVELLITAPSPRSFIRARLRSKFRFSGNEMTTSSGKQRRLAESNYQLGIPLRSLRALPRAEE